MVQCQEDQIYSAMSVNEYRFKMLKLAVTSPSLTHPQKKKELNVKCKIF